MCSGFRWKKNGFKKYYRIVPIQEERSENNLHMKTHGLLGKLPQ